MVDTMTQKLVLVPLQEWPDRFLDAVARVTGVAAEDILVRGKSTRLSRGHATYARQLLFWAAREWTPGKPSWRRLSELYNIDHTTLRSGWIAIRRRLSHKDFAEKTQLDVAALQRRLSWRHEIRVANGMKKGKKS
jgi:hypothetical protein